MGSAIKSYASVAYGGKVIELQAGSDVTVDNGYPELKAQPAYTSGTSVTVNRGIDLSTAVASIKIEATNTESNVAILKSIKLENLKNQSKPLTLIDSDGKPTVFTNAFISDKLEFVYKAEGGVSVTFMADPQPF